ncbi:MAG: NAD(P)H-dependent oxidoreductase [Dehalococcoidia bacterium]
MQDDRFHILGIAGSLRRASYNRGLLRAAQEVTPEGVEIEIFDLNEIPPYNADLDTETPPEAVRALRERIASANALLFATPEYNTTMPGVLKNAVDWASRPFRSASLRFKPIGLMGASGGRFATVRSQADLRQVLTILACYVMPFPYVAAANASELFDENGNLTDDGVRQQVRGVVEALVSWSRRVQPD